MPAFLFPGQGSQASGMGSDFFNQSAVAREVFERAQPELPPDFLEILFSGSEEAVRDTRVAQVGLVLVGAAISAHVRALGIEPTGAAGHSVGEIAALHAVGVFSLEEALRLTRERARLMAEESPDGTMAAVLGLEPEAIAAALPDQVDIANFNSPGQTIISGPRAAVEKARSILKDAGAKRVMPLPVSGPFHSWCMRAAAEKFRDCVAGVSIQAPKIRFVSSVSGSEEREPERIRELLCAQLYSPVRWTDVMRALGPCDALEVGPGAVLAGLAKRTEGAPAIEPVGTIVAANALVAPLSTGD